MDSEKEDCIDPICSKTDPLQKYRKFVSKFDELNEDLEEEQNEDKKDSNGKKSDELNNLFSYYKYCPNSRESLGFYTWNYLHTLSVYYPEKPNENEKTMMKSFLDAFAYFYPCKICSKDLKRHMKQLPPNIENQKELAIWMCKQHNFVNQKLGKPIFDCSFENLLKRWKTGYDHCKNIKPL